MTTSEETKTSLAVKITEKARDLVSGYDNKVLIEDWWDILEDRYYLVLNYKTPTTYLTWVCLNELKFNETYEFVSEPIDGEFVEVRNLIVTTFRSYYTAYSDHLRKEELWTEKTRL